MASVGFARRAGLPRPFGKDRERRVYMIAAEVAASVLDSIAALDAVKRGATRMRR